jgi:hypothetical protein
MAKIASMHKIGPQIHKIFGFDLVIFHDCAKFVL